MINGLSKKILGIDIRSHGVSAVLVKSSLKGLRFENHVTIDTPETLKENKESFLDALKALTSQLDTSGALCVVSLPFDQLSFRHIKVPFKEKRKIRQVLPFEVEALLPSPLSDFIIDFQPLMNDENSRQTDLIVAAVQQQEMKYYLDGLKSFELDPETVTIGNYCTAKVLSGKTAAPKDWILIDINTDTVTATFSMGEEVKTLRAFRVPPDGPRRHAQIENRIYHTVLAVQQQFGGTIVPEKVYMTGDGRGDNDIAKALEKRLNVSVEPLDILGAADIELLQQPPVSEQQARWQAALALCLVEAHSIPVFNFRKGPFAKKKFWLEHTKDLIRSGSIAAIVLLLMGIGYIVESYSLDKQNAGIDRQIMKLLRSAYPDATSTAGALEKMKVKVQGMKQTSLFSDETETIHNTIDILNEISRLAPNNLDVKLDKLSISSGIVQISGDTATFNMVDDLKGKLETSKIFSSVDITSANLNKSGNRVDFKLKLQLR